MTLRLTGELASADDATIDHFFPRSEGGPDGWRNWVLACRTCNNKKASRQPSQPEIAAWNKLASSWPYIRAIDVELVRKKRCVVCQCWISPIRLGDSIISGAETETCRPRCGRGQRRQLKRACGLEQAEPPPPHLIEPAQTGRLESWWSKLLTSVRRYLASV